MKYRKLRIAWSVFCGLAAVLLIVLWVRSYYAKDLLDVAAPPHWLVIESVGGRISFRLMNEPTILSSRLSFNSYGPTFARFGTNINEQVSVLDGAIALAIAVAGILPWLQYRPRRRQFSLRSLLIATMLVAVVLGLAAYEIRK